MSEKLESVNDDTSATPAVVVTVLDRNKANAAALHLLVGSLSVHAPEVLARLHVLHPPSEIAAPTTQYLHERAVHTHALPVWRGEDPYRLKFLLARFVRDRCAPAGAIVYLDPDHVLLGPFPPIVAGAELVVSSEVPPDDAETYGQAAAVTHYNTSVISGSREAWLRVTARWANAYRRLRSRCPVRYREERAFGDAAALAGVPLLRAAPSLQSNFGVFTPDCRLFHYGGEYGSARQFKQWLRDGPLNESALRALFPRNATKSEQLLVEAAAQALPFATRS